MTTTTAVTFAIETVKSVKSQMIMNGIADERIIFAACNKLSVILNLPVSTVVILMENC